MKVGYIGGFWATNIGNSFYDLGALALLEKIVGKDNVYFIPDIAKWFWNVSDNYEPLMDVELDLFIFAGPLLDESIINYKYIFDRIKVENKKIAFISAGASYYTINERDVVLNFLNNYKSNVLFLSTRDKETFELYENSGINIFNGICTSMFLNDAITPPLLNNKYVVFNFSFFKEPYVKLENGKIKIYKRGFFSKFQDELDDMEIIKTNHETFSRFKKLLFNRRKMYYSDIPFGYLAIYKNAKFVFSDRVHTCAATLIFGGKAMYIKGSKRSHDGRNNLFKRIGVDSIYHEPTSLNFEYINIEKSNMVDFIKTNIEGIE